MPHDTHSEAPFKVWRTIEIGRHKSAMDMVYAIDRIGGSVSESVKGLLGEMKFADKLKTVQLVVLSVAELGFSESATAKQIVREARTRGLRPCSGEMAMALREQYTDQPCPEWLKVAVDLDGELLVLSIGRVDVADQLLTYSYEDNNTSYENKWLPVARWVFVLPDKQ